MPSRYVLQVVPSDGPTLLSDTKREWLHDADFEVVHTDYMPFQHTKRQRRNGFKFRITRQDVINAERHYGIRFNVWFTAKTVTEYFTDLADTDYAVDQSIKSFGLEDS